MSSSGQPLMPVNEIQAREYNFRTPEGQMELLKQTAADKQSRAEMLARQLEREDAAQIRDETQDRQDIRADNRDIALVKAAEERKNLAEFKANNKPVPYLQTQARIKNKTQLDVIKEAYEAVVKNPDAFGAKNYLGIDIMQRVDPKGIDARDKVGKINAIELHNLSGAAVNPSEAPRFTPFLPSPTDTPEKIKTNLKNMYFEVLNMEQERNLAYSDGFAPTLKPLDDYVNYSFDKTENSAGTKQTVDSQKADSFTSPSDGITYARPPNVTDEDWERYKKNEGVK
jgi:hypothetical protein